MRGDPKCKICRRAGEKLFLKGERCSTPKCAMVRKPYPPGSRRRARSKRSLSEYGVQLRAKQKIRFSYAIPDRQLRRYFRQALHQKRGSAAESLYQMLERRLDNVVFRLGITKSRSVARQIVSHGHITVNGKEITIPSYSVSVGDSIGIASGSETVDAFHHLRKEKRGKQPPIPDWLVWDGNKNEGSVAAPPTLEASDQQANLQHIIEFYSR